jgi:alcohol dehydrogenase class IV
LTTDPDASAADGIRWVTELVRDLNIPSLSVYGMGHEHLPEAVEKTLKASSTKGNPIPLTEIELTGILERAL